MSMRNYTVYLAGGAALHIKAARFEVTDRGVFFYDEHDRPLEDTYIDPTAVRAVIPPTPAAGQGGTGFSSVEG